MKGQNQFLVTEKTSIKVVYISKMKSFNNQHNKFLAYAEVDG